MYVRNTKPLRDCSALSLWPSADVELADASRFLAQSQSRLNFSQADQSNSRNPLERHRVPPHRTPSRGYLQRRPAGNPQHGSESSRFPFASRLSAAPAPLFYSATDEFREEDDTEEHEREVADFFALQRSRRDFSAARRSPDSSDEDIARKDFAKTTMPQTQRSQRVPKLRGTGRGIRSSWPGEDVEQQDKDRISDSSDEPQNQALPASTASSVLGKSRARLVDINLDFTIAEADELAEEPQDVRHDQEEENPPSLQQLRNHRGDQSQLRSTQFSARPLESAPLMSRSTPLSPNTGSPSPVLNPSTSRSQNHDSFWSTLFLINMIAMIATFFLVLLHTYAPTRNSLLGDTIYTTMQKSFHLLAVDTVVAIVVALVWLAALRSFVRPLVLLILGAVPIIALAFSLYPFISSFKASRAEPTLQDKAMRWLSFLPAVFSTVWVYTIYKGRHSLDRAIDLLEFATRILTACPTLVMVGFLTLGIVVSWTWIWMMMFTRIFLGGHAVTGSKQLFIINTGTWWLGAYFILTYLWSLGVISGLQRATNAAATSQWYFYRNAAPSPSPISVVHAAFTHASTKILGTICLSTLLSLAIRLPLLILPGRISSYVSLCFYSLIPTSIATLTNPLTLTYAAVHSQPLTVSARGLSELTFVAPTSAAPTTTLTPRAFSKNYPNNQGTPSLVAYRLAKLLLHTTRLATSLAFGFGGWVSTAKMLPVESISGGGGVRGSLYAYVVGLVAGAIGWTVLGAMEGVLSGVLDAVVVCWGSEMQSHGFGQARFCREAGELLQDDGAVGL